MADRLENKLKALCINGVVESVIDSTFYTDYKVIFDDNITYNKIKSRLKDVSHFMRGKTELIEKNYNYYLRVYKDVDHVVSLGNFQDTIENTPEGLPVAIGEDDNGNNVIFDLCKMPHLLVSGSTGSGKSVFLHDIILSLLFSGRCELVLIDVKRVEFSRYKNISMLSCDVVNDVKSAKKVLKAVCDLMDDRYKLLESTGVRNISDYRQKHGNLNYICVVIDELADIMLQAKKDVEKYIIRIAQLGRAAGIHLVCATQKPSCDVVTSLIKSNIPSRVCFSVQSSIDSRVILDQKGGESLKGNGDGLFLPIGSNDPIHFQAPYVSDEELDQITN